MKLFGASDTGTYAELGGLETERIADALQEPLGLSVEYYDADSADYIDLLYSVTVQITISFSIVIIIYYFLIIHTVLTRLGSMMNDEFRFCALLPKLADEGQSL
jgi:hypothetical protein